MKLPSEKSFVEENW